MVTFLTEKFVSLTLFVEKKSLNYRTFPEVQEVQTNSDHSVMQIQRVQGGKEGPGGHEKMRPEGRPISGLLVDVNRIPSKPSKY